MFKPAISIVLLVALGIGLLAWARPDVRQKLVNMSAQASISMRNSFSAAATATAKAGTQIGAYFQGRFTAIHNNKAVSKPEESAQTAFHALGQWISGLVASIGNWFQQALRHSA